MIDLREKIREIIKRETDKKHFYELNLDSSVELVQQLFENYETTNDLHQDFSDLPKKGELIFLAAPTGAGKDSLVIKLNANNPDKKYIELNMDMFRHYFPMFIKDLSSLTDKTFAKQTNEFSYEIFMTIQELILNEFPGANIIITGTLRETNWPEQILKNYKNSKNTDYEVKLISLAVPRKESAISTIKRYVEIVDDQNKRPDFLPGTARYTSLDYHDETYERFPINLSYFEESLENNPGELIDSMEVYRRSKSMLDFEDDNLVYSSERDQDKSKTALMAIHELRTKEYEIDIDTAKYILEKIQNNVSYLKSQGTFDEVIANLGVLLRQDTYRELISHINNLLKQNIVVKPINDDNDEHNI